MIKGTETNVYLYMRLLLDFLVKEIIKIHFQRSVYNRSFKVRRFQFELISPYFHWRKSAVHTRF